MPRSFGFITRELHVFNEDKGNLKTKCACTYCTKCIPGTNTNSIHNVKNKIIEERLEAVRDGMKSESIRTLVHVPLMQRGLKRGTQFTNATIHMCCAF